MVEEEDLCRRTLEASLGPVAVADASGLLVYVNPAFLTLVGRACREDVVGRPAAGFFESPELARAAMATVAREGRCVCELTVLRPDGVLRRVEVSCSVLTRDAQGAPDAIMGSFFDLTERVAARERLRLSEARYRTLIDSAPEAITVLDVGTGRFVDCNSKAEALFRLPRGELLRLGPAELSPPLQPCGTPSGDKARRLVQEAVEGGTPEFEWEHSDGAGRELLCEVRLVRLPSEGPPLVRGTLTEISARRRDEQAFNETARRLALATEAVGMGVWDLDLVTGAVTPDARLSDRWGVPAEQRSAAAWAQALHPDDAAGVRAAHAAAVAARGRLHHEFRIVRPDGGVRYVEAHAVVVTVPGGAPVRMTGVNWDITARRREEAARRELLARLQKLASQVPGVVYQFKLRPDGSSCFPYASERIREIYRVSPEEVQEDASKVFAILHPEDHDGIVESIQRSARTLQPWLYEYRTRFPDGAVRWLLGSSVPERLADGSTLWHGFITDVTERRRAEDELREKQQLVLASEATLRAIFDQAAVGVAEIEARTGRFVRVNHRYGQLLGWTLEDLLGRTLPDTTHADDRAGLEERLRLLGAGAGARELDLELRCVHRTGSTVWVRLTAAPMSDAEHHVVVAQDLTDRKHAEALLQQAQKLESVGRLAGGVAHDFNNLLTAIFGFAEVARPHVAPGSLVATCLSSIVESGQRGALLTRQLLAFARKQIVKPEPVDLNVVLGGMGALLERLIGEDVDLQVRLAPTLGTVKVDAGGLEQVIMNLAVNARDAMPDGGTLTLETLDVVLDPEYARTHPDVTPGPYVLLAVTDTGTGMGPEVAARLFEPFFTTKPAGQGTGLGLAMCHGFVKQAGGHVAVYTEASKGTSIKVYLPLAEETPAEGVARRDEDARRRAAVEPAAQGGDETLLVVEDDAVIRGLVCGALVAQGYRVLVAADGEEALGLVERTPDPIHLVITDVVMPRMGGKELAERLARLRPGIKVLFTSGYTENAIVHQGVLEDGVNFLHKPYTPSRLLSLVRTTLG